MRNGDVLNEPKETTGLVFNIQRFSIHDGPGIRTLVFMQGCSLACKWCCNPEGQKSYPQLRFISVKCVGADKCRAPCVEACPEGAITLSEEGKAQTDRKLCANCGKCAEACLYGARTILGKRMTVEEVLDEVEKDRLFYNRSGGGITVGGGEPLMQFEFVLQLLKRCKERFLHTALETCGHAPGEHLKQISEYVDLMYYDIKHMDPARHKELTGVSNELILSNARRVLSGEVNCEVIVRTAIIPGSNDSEDNIEATARFVAESGGKMMELLPYHGLGSSKYRQLGMEYELKDTRPPTDEQMERLRNIVESFGLKEMTGVF
ncbi:MAG: glycyl-radical enzyme activating protein [Dehalococcoidia bacterium]|nr:MAG: glycyl-radical enzyme activating protein [Dehalococcoidia bacterium]